MNTPSDNDSSPRPASTGSAGVTETSQGRDSSLESLQTGSTMRADDADAMPTAAAQIAGTGVPGSSVSPPASSSETFDGMSGKKEVLRQELGQLKTELDTLVSHAARLSERELSEAYQMLMARFQTYRTKCRDMAGNYGQQINQQMDATMERVKEKPVQSVAIAAGAGMLMGLAMRRRRRDHQDR